MELLLQLNSDRNKCKACDAFDLEKRLCHAEK